MRGIIINPFPHADTSFAFLQQTKFENIVANIEITHIEQFTICHHVFNLKASLTIVNSSSLTVTRSLQWRFASRPIWSLIFSDISGSACFERFLLSDFDGLLEMSFRYWGDKLCLILFIGLNYFSIEFELYYHRNLIYVWPATSRVSDDRFEMKGHISCKIKDIIIAMALNITTPFHKIKWHFDALVV